MARRLCSPPELIKLSSESEDVEVKKMAFLLLEELVFKDKEYEQPLNHLLLADLSEFFFDYASAMNLLKKLQTLILPEIDNELNQLVEDVYVSDNCRSENQKVYFDNADKDNCTSPISLAHYQLEEPRSETEKIFKFMFEQCDEGKWIEKHIVSSFYRRLTNINSNEIEDIFVLDKTDREKLVKHGFCSELPHDSQIVRILRDMDIALQYAIEWANHNETEINTEFIQEVHSLVIKSNRFEEREENEIVVIPIRKWRRTTVFHGKTVFPFFEEVPELIENFLEVVNQILKEMKENRSVEATTAFSNAAYIHNSFVEIHPFTDGNGRTARIIASLPLLIVGLPPICVRSCQRNTYFDVIVKTRKEKDLSILAKFLAEEMLASVQESEDYV
uniref:Fido domain-containing protein n=1 Tax=Strigamia maritima TaxID=126957 RepID=T1IWM6_STRMM